MTVAIMARVDNTTLVHCAAETFRSKTMVRGDNHRLPSDLIVLGVPAGRDEFTDRERRR